MTTKIQIKRGEANGVSPTGLSPGELAVEMADPTKLWVGVPITLDSTGKKLLFDSSASVGGFLPIDNPTCTGIFTASAPAGNNVTIEGRPAGQNVWLRAAGADANVGVSFSSKGAAATFFYSHDLVNIQMAIAPQAVAGYVNITGGDGGTNISMQGGAGAGVITIFNATLTGETTATIDGGEWV